MRVEFEFCWKRPSVSQNSWWEAEWDFLSCDGQRKNFDLLPNVASSLNKNLWNKIFSYRTSKFQSPKVQTFFTNPLSQPLPTNDPHLFESKSCEFSNFPAPYDKDLEERLGFVTSLELCWKTKLTPARVKSTRAESYENPRDKLAQNSSLWSKQFVEKNVDTFCQINQNPK